MEFWVSFDESGECLEEEVEPVPFDKPTEETDHDLTFQLEFLDEGGGVRRFIQEVGLDCVGMDEDLFRRDAMFLLDIPFEVGGNGDDPGCVSKGGQVAPLGVWGEEGLFADPLVPNQFIDFHYVGDACFLCDFACGGEEEGVAFVDEGVLFLRQALANLLPCLQVVSDFCDFKKKAGQLGCNGVERGDGLALGEGVGTCVVPGVFSCRAFKIHMVAEAFQGIGNARDVDGFRSDPACTEAVENIHGILCRGLFA